MIDSDALITSIIVGGGAAGIISFINNVVMFKMQRKATKEDKKDNENEWKKQVDDRLAKDEDKTSQVAKKIDEIKTGQEIILYDRIRYLGKNYIKAGEIEFEDRSILHKMYAAYRALGGSEEDDLRILMKEINELKTKN